MSENAVDGDLALAREALGVLDANWLGHGTRPSQLYPHQWSWDSACIAMGYARWNQDRAERELRSLFAGQWANGLLPHIVFASGDGRYFPGPEFWQSDRSSDAPSGIDTSGIVQPPIHATAALRLHQQSADHERSLAFLAELAPKLAAWHAYLYRERTRGDDGLVEIWHPWESGMDNSPLWDEALRRINPNDDEIPEYERVDVELANPAERPTDGEYDRYVYLVGLFRGLDYRSDRIQEVTPFALQSVLFNSLLVQANRDLAEIARLLDEETTRYEEWAELTATGIDTKLWSATDAVYADYDLIAQSYVAARTAAGLSPLHAGIPTPERARRMIEELAGSRVDVNGGESWVVTSLSPRDPGFMPTRYWRGPIWPILNWALQRGLDRYGYHELATQVRRALIDLSSRGGFWEHYSPVTGKGHGGASFAWTAGLVLDVLATEMERGKEVRVEERLDGAVDDTVTSGNERRE